VYPSNPNLAWSLTYEPEGTGLVDAQLANVPVEEVEHNTFVERLLDHAKAGATAASPKTTAAAPSNASFVVLLFSNILAVRVGFEYICRLKPGVIDMNFKSSTKHANPS
jgi:hypothetical protein